MPVIGPAFDPCQPHIVALCSGVVVWCGRGVKYGEGRCVCVCGEGMQNLGPMQDEYAFSPTYSLTSCCLGQDVGESDPAGWQVPRCRKPCCASKRLRHASLSCTGLNSWGSLLLELRLAQPTAWDRVSCIDRLGRGTKGAPIRLGWPRETTTPCLRDGWCSAASC